MKPVLLLSFLPVLLFATPKQSAPLPVITLQVLNPAGLDQRSLASAENVAAEIWRRAGIGLEFVTCQAGLADWLSPDICQRDLDALEFRIWIVNRAPSISTTSMLGFTEVGEDGRGGSSAVYLPAAIAIAGSSMVALPLIIGAALAHEIGHLILGLRAHTVRGIMASRFEKAEYDLLRAGDLDFNPSQARLLREEVLRRRPDTRLAVE